MGEMHVRGCIEGGCFTTSTFLLSAGNKLGGQSVQSILSSLFQTSASVWISRCVAECLPVWTVRSQDGCLMSVGLLQVLKLQESPDAVPKGEMPRHMQLYCDRYLTDRVVPGNRITVIGIYSIRKAGIKPAKV